MSVRFDASGDRYTATTGLPSTVWTATMWARLASDRDDYSTLFSLHNGTDDEVIALQTGDGGRDLRVWIEPAAGNVDPGVKMTVGVWYRVAVVRDGSDIAYYFGPDSGAPTTDTGTLTGAVNQTVLQFSEAPTSSEGTRRWNGNIANFKLSSAALSESEIIAEWANWQPQRTADLLRHHKWQSGASTADDSGNGHTLTVGGTPSTDSGNPNPTIGDGAFPASTHNTTSSATGTANTVQPVSSSGAISPTPTVEAVRDDAAAVTAGTVSEAAVTADQTGADVAATTAAITADGTAEAVTDLPADLSADITADVTAEATSDTAEGEPVRCFLAAI